MTLGILLLVLLGIVAATAFFVRVLPVLRHGRVVTLDRPRPCSLREAHDAQDKLLSAGIDAVIIGYWGDGLNRWSSTKAADQVEANDRFVVQVPRKQAGEARSIV